MKFNRVVIGVSALALASGIAMAQDFTGAPIFLRGSVHGNQAGAPNAQVDPARTAALAAAVRASLVNLPADAQQVDAEAAIVFAVDQSGLPLDSAVAGLQTVDRTGLSSVAVAALDSVIANRMRLSDTGTAALAGNGEPALAQGFQTLIGGGGSDYFATR